MSLVRRARSRLREERGIALVMSLFVMTFFGMVLTSLIYYTTSNTSASSRQRADQQAFALAEAGLNDAISRLGADPTNPDAVPVTPTAATQTGSTYKGSVLGSRWTLTGLGSVRNPASSTPVTRQVTQKVDVFYTPPTNIWNYLYSDATTGCMVVKNNGGIDAPLYVRGNLCIENNAEITRSPLQVEGTLDIANNGSVGTASARLSNLKLKGGCLPNPHPCTEADDVYATSYPISTMTDGLTKPVVNFSSWYHNASPGPKHYCTSGSMPGGFDTDYPAMNGSRPIFDLTPATGYSCSTNVGQISWTPGNPGTLIVSGVIFFDGSVMMNNNARAVYSGKATIYANGSVTLENGAELCAISGCTASWNTSENVLMFVASLAAPGYGFHLKQGGEYQGAAYAVGDYRLENNARNWGPVVANQLHIDNNSEQMYPLTAIPPGAPGTDPQIRIVPQTYSG